MKERILKIVYEACEDERVYDENIDLLEEVIDSMAIIELISRLEDEFSIELQPTEIPLDTWRHVGNIVEMIEGKIREDE